MESSLPPQSTSTFRIISVTSLVQAQPLLRRQMHLRPATSFATLWTTRPLSRPRKAKIRPRCKSAQPGAKASISKSYNRRPSKRNPKDRKSWEDQRILRKRNSKKYRLNSKVTLLSEAFKLLISRHRHKIEQTLWQRSHNHCSLKNSKEPNQCKLSKYNKDHRQNS